MSQASAIFTFRQEEIIIKCLTTEKMKNICERFTLQINQNINKLNFKYDGNLINEELKYEEQVNEKNKDSMNIIVEVVEEENKSKINGNIELEENKDKINDNKEKVENENNKMNDNYIIAEIYIEEENINKNIRIYILLKNLKEQVNWWNIIQKIVEMKKK